MPRSQKTGFCIAPTDTVDLLLPDAVWQPSFIGFAGQCGNPAALWVREMMPAGWGDTYIQPIAGQASGTPGHRHFRVPAWNGIDPEG